jgi:hypothetical protein
MKKPTPKVLDGGTGAGSRTLPMGAAGRPMAKAPKKMAPTRKMQPKPGKRGY